MKEGKKKIVGDTTARFEAHALLIIKEKTTRNNLRRWTIIFDNRKSFDVPPKVCSGSNTLARATCT
jgi:hypothetical protein